MNVDINRIKWVDKIKGVLSLLVFTHHFLYSFYPRCFIDDSSLEHSFFEKVLFRQPFSIICNGNFFVCIFLVLSAFVLAKKANRELQSIDVVSNNFIKRYLRFVMPLLIACLITYVIKEIGLFSNEICSQITFSKWLKNGKNYSLIDVFKDSLIFIPLTKSGEIIGTTWMLNYTFYGYYLIYLLSFALSNRNKLFKCAVIIIGCICCLALDSYMICYFIGYAITIIDNEVWRNKYLKKTALALLLIVSIVLGSYQSYEACELLILKHIARLCSNYGVTDYAFFHQIAAGCFILFFDIVCKNHDKTKNNFLDFLGKLSFSIFLVHEAIIKSIASSSFLVMFNRGINYNSAAGIAYLLCLVFVIVFSFLFSKIELLCYKITDKIIKRTLL